MALDPNYIFAENSTDLREPNAQELDTGQECGEADIKLHDWLWHNHSKRLASLESDADNFALLPIHAKVGTADHRVSLVDNSDSTVTLDPCNITLHGGLLYDLGNFTLAERTFAVADGVTYHLRFDGPGTGTAIPKETYPNGRLRFVDVTDGAYNPGALPESDAAFDGTYDSALLARIGPDRTGDIIPVMTATTTAGVTMTSSSSFDETGTYYAWRAADASLSSFYLSSGAAPQWIRAQFPSAKTASGFLIKPRNLHRPTAFHLEGSNDGSTWTDLTGEIAYATWNVETNAAVAFDVPVANQAPFTNYRLRVTDTDSNTFVSVVDFQIFEDNGLELLTLRNASRLGGEVSKATTQTSTNLSGETAEFVAIDHAIGWSRTPFAAYAEQRIGAATANLDEGIVNVFLDVDRYSVRPLVIGAYSDNASSGGIINGRYRVVLQA